MSRHTTNNMPVKVNTVMASPIAAPLTTSIPGLTSVRNIFGTAPARRHTVSQMPSTHFSPRLPITSGGDHHKSQPSVSSLFTGGVIGISGAPKKTAAEKAAERDWDEQAKQIFQLSTVSAKGHFLPPSPSPLEYTIQAGGGGVGGLMSSSHDRFKDNDADYFTTIIISTSPEKVRTFLSTESSISPGMFSPSANKIKRSAIPSFSTPPLSSSSSSTVSSSLPSSPSEPSSTRSLTPTVMSQQQQVATVQGEKNSNVIVVFPTDPPSPPSISSVAVPPVAAIPAAIPKRRVVAPADTLSTPPSSPPAISAKDMYFPAEATETATPSSTTSYIPVPVTPPNSTPRTAPITPRTPQSSSSNPNYSQRQRHRRPHQESPMHRNSRVAEEEEEEEEEDGHNAGGRDSSRTVLNKRRAQISFLTGVTPMEEEDLSDIFAHTVYNCSSNNSRSKSNNRYLSSSSLLSSSPPDLLFGYSSNTINDKNALSSLLDASPRRMSSSSSSSSSSSRVSIHQQDRERTRQINTHKIIAQNAF